MKTVKVTEAPAYTRQKYEATLAEWDLGMPVGYGQTIQEALENFIEKWELHFDEELKYQWS